MCYQIWLFHKMSQRTSYMFPDDTAANVGISIRPNSTTRSEDQLYQPQKYALSNLPKCKKEYSNNWKENPPMCVCMF